MKLNINIKVVASISHKINSFYWAYW